MAAKPIQDSIKQAIIAEWRTGEYSQQKLADRHGVSKGAVNKLTKGMPQDTAVIVTAGIEYLHGLAGHDDRNVTAIESVVEEKTKHIEFYDNSQNKLAQLTLLKLDQHITLGEDGKPWVSDEMSFQDMNAAANILQKSRDGVLGKSPETLIQINNNGGLRIPANEIRDRLKRLGLSVGNE